MNMRGNPKESDQGQGGKGAPRRLVTADILEGELTGNIRPTRLDEFVGQEKLRKKLMIFVEAAKKRGEALDHVLLSGPPGVGKTTIASILASELEVDIVITSGPVFERQGDLAAILTNMKPRDILFIDEIHRLNRTVEEVLYPALEDFKLDIILGKGPSARTIRLQLNPFTLVGATTRAGMLSAPLRNRFGVQAFVDYYPPEELVEILARAASRLLIPAEREGLEELARRGRGTPRIALRLLKRVRDIAEVESDGKITKSIAKRALDLLEIDPIGLDYLDRKILETIILKHGGGPVSLDTIAVSVGEEADTIYDVYEPYLIQIGFIDRTPRGRVATRRAYEHLGIACPRTDVLPEQTELF